MDSSPEKAGVGGSIPSLATLFSDTYRHSISGFGSNWFQFGSQRFVSTTSRFTIADPDSKPAREP